MGLGNATGTSTRQPEVGSGLPKCGYLERRSERLRDIDALLGPGAEDPKDLLHLFVVVRG